MPYVALHNLVTKIKSGYMVIIKSITIIYKMKIRKSHFTVH